MFGVYRLTFPPDQTQGFTQVLHFSGKNRVCVDPLDY